MMLCGGATIMGSTVVPLEGVIGRGPCPAFGHFNPQPLVVQGELFVDVVVQGS
jgi:hypothetical protein